MLLVAATVSALLWANSPWGESYERLCHTEVAADLAHSGVHGGRPGPVAGGPEVREAALVEVAPAGMPQLSDPRRRAPARPDPRAGCRLLPAFGRRGPARRGGRRPAVARARAAAGRADGPAGRPSAGRDARRSTGGGIRAARRGRRRRAGLGAPGDPSRRHSGCPARRPAPVGCTGAGPVRGGRTTATGGYAARTGRQRHTGGLRHAGHRCILGSWVASAYMGGQPRSIASVRSS